MELIKDSVFDPKSTFRNQALFAVHDQLIDHHVNTKGCITPAVYTRRGNRGIYKSDEQAGTLE